MRKTILLILTITLSTIICAGCDRSTEVDCIGKTVVMSKKDFNDGKLKNIEFNDEEALILKNNKLKGEYLSPIINTGDYKRAVFSWNIKPYNGTEIEVFVQARQNNKWSRWFSYGRWSYDDKRGSIARQYDKIAKLSIDTLSILGDKTADGLRYKVNFYREDLNTNSPEMNLVAASMKYSDEIIDKKIEEAGNIDLKEEEWEIELDVPKRSQLSVPKIGNIICGPTALSMVLEYYGFNIPTEKVAKMTKDNSIGIYGNWSYNVAYAGSLGLKAYVDRFETMEEIKEKISQGVPVIASIQTRYASELEGAPGRYPSGHLIVIRGFVIKDGEEYIIANDPAVSNNEEIRKEYKAEQFYNVWRRIVYIIEE